MSLRRSQRSNGVGLLTERRGRRHRGDPGARRHLREGRSRRRPLGWPWGHGTLLAVGLHGLSRLTSLLAVGLHGLRSLLTSLLLTVGLHRLRSLLRSLLAVGLHGVRRSLRTRLLLAVGLGGLVRGRPTSLVDRRRPSLWLLHPRLLNVLRVRLLLSGRGLGLGLCSSSVILLLWVRLLLMRRRLVRLLVLLLGRQRLRRLGRSSWPESCRGGGGWSEVGRNSVAALTVAALLGVGVGATGRRRGWGGRLGRGGHGHARGVTGLDPPDGVLPWEPRVLLQLLLILLRHRQGMSAAAAAAARRRPRHGVLRGVGPGRHLMRRRRRRRRVALLVRARRRQRL